MNQIDRILQIWLYISDKRFFTTRELAEKFSVSKRTVTRDLDYLATLGVPLYSIRGNGGGYKMLKNPILPPVTLSEGEILSIFFALTMLKKLQTIPYDAELWELEDKLKKQMTSSVLQKVKGLEQTITYVVPPRNVNNQFLRKCLKAALDRKAIRMTYMKTGANASVHCQPIGLYSMNGFWYLVAFVPGKQDYRIYRIDRILKLGELKNPIASNLLTIDEWIATLKDKQRIEVKLVVDDEAIRTITNYWLINSHQQPYQPGSQLLTCSLPKVQLFSLRQDILKLGSKAKVLSPQSLVSELKVEIQKMSQNYLAD
ncbi:helix-turn-helix transcriptional regulator [Lentilactobacillus kisonensis]|uniref:HTH domain protein n=3 Tax=Lentilactobacillus kisonensis TaxID=481722 RepID=H1LIC0_9LACO|nr:YafY family protein [Lentilactobacillus kisonensis]EHO49873.1 HTH domain protein [Lentilactobacillus kisonensis F0435]KRL20138.1 HTH domain protein [Lentilactobacillus kisonensis DSM 19906 = JCM 15041]